jgi:UDP-N-acetyl-D-glucosamine dehydrogenase
MELLQERGAVLSYCDPHIPTLPAMRSFDVPRLASEEMSAEYLSSLDCTLIATDHSAFDWQLVTQYSKLVVDTRNACAGVECGREKVWQA